MISICIPIYNCYAYPLARRLATQAAALGDDVELVCIDDHSSAFYEQQNHGLAEVSNYVRLAEHIGMARLYNLFLRYAKGDYLLFVDSRMQVGENFLSRYHSALEKRPAVIVGGLSIDRHSDDTEHHLCYVDTCASEIHTLDYRRRHAYATFRTDNFIIRRDIFEAHPFDPKRMPSGLERLLFAYALEQARVPINHIENPVTLQQLASNLEHLHVAIDESNALVTLYDRMWEDQRFCHSVMQIRRFERMRRLHLDRAVLRLFRLFRRPLEEHLARGNGVTAMNFNFYRLGVFLDKYVGQ